MTVHPSAAEGFSRGAAAYERGRPSYPKALLEWLIGAAPITRSSVVLDLGAGTGKFTRLLVPTGASVIALEPVRAMREALAEIVPGVRILDGTAQAIPLDEGSVDMVVAAQAFHWFATPAAVEEIHRVLRPDGVLALIWNRRDLSDPLQAGLDDIVRPHRGRAPAHEWDNWRGAIAGEPRFRPASECQFRMEQVLDQDGAVDRVVSTSFIASLDEARRAQVITRVRSLIPAQGTVVLRYVTDSFLFRRD